MVSLVQKVLFPMDLKRYMVLSFATLWTLVLVLGLVTAIVHQVNYQGSAGKLNLEWKIGELSSDLSTAKQTILEQSELIKVLKCPWYFSCETVSDE